MTEQHDGLIETIESLQGSDLTTLWSLLIGGAITLVGSVIGSIIFYMYEKYSKKRELKRIINSKLRVIEQIILKSHEKSENQEKINLKWFKSSVMLLEKEIESLFHLYVQNDKEVDSLINLNAHTFDLMEWIKYAEENRYISINAKLVREILASMEYIFNS
ncbi:hypothetical protein [Desemzia sp. FAM 24101]|uniref:hypothetical protein n=1 Tax=unclassified Desemzia TaxID=2685243 RepID=UPI0038883D6E